MIKANINREIIGDRGRELIMRAFDVKNKKQLEEIRSDVSDLIIDIYEYSKSGGMNDEDAKESIDILKRYIDSLEMHISVIDK